MLIAEVRQKKGSLLTLRLSASIICCEFLFFSLFILCAGIFALSNVMSLDKFGLLMS